MKRTALCLLVAFHAVSVGAEPAGSGRDTAHYSADRAADFLHMHLEMQFTPETILGRTARGRVVHTFTARGGDVDTLRLDAVDMRIRSVEVLGEEAAAEYSYDDRQLAVRLPRAVSSGQTAQVAVDYEVHDPPKGLHFILPSDSAPDKRTMVYTMSEALEARYWVPCHDWPNERWTTDLLVTVPEQFTVVSNGELAEKRADGSGRVRYHWRNDVPTDPHLMGFVFGELVELDGTTWRGRPVRVFTQPGHEQAARYTFRRVDQMLDFYSALIDIDFPYPGYTHVTVVDHHHGGMEHAGYSLLRPLYLSVDENSGMTGTIERNFTAHMLAHQWFGGIANYRSVSEAWLNEGFATYLDHLWLGYAYGDDHFEELMWRSARRSARFDSSETGIPMVNRDFEDLEDVYRADGSKIYFKGAWVLHMLRHRMGDELFWRAVASYLERFRGSAVETADLRRVLEEESGLDLQQFFQQWVYGRGIPRLEVQYAWDAESRQVTVTVQQTQQVDAATPAFAFPLDLLFRVDGRDVERRVEMAETRQEFSFQFDEQPSLFVVDPYQRLLKALTVDVPRAMNARQALEGPTVVSKLAAIEAMGEETDSGGVDVLADLLGDPEQSRVVQTAAARALGRMQRDEALAALVHAHRQGPLHPEVSSAIMTALGQYPVSSVAHEILLAATLAGDTAWVESAALSALGGMRARGELTDRTLARLQAAVRDVSNYWVRSAALGALVRLEHENAYETVFDLAQPGRSDPLRYQAIRALGTLGKLGSLGDQTRRFLTACLYDPDRLAQSAAISALGTLGDMGAVADLQRLAASAHHSETRTAAQAAIRAIGSAEADPETLVPALRQQIIALEQRQQELEESLQELKRQVERRDGGTVAEGQATGTE